MKNIKQYQYTIINDLVYINIYAKDGSHQTTIIDLFNLEKFLEHKYSWHLLWTKNVNGYYIASTYHLGIVDGKRKSKTVYLHKYLMDISDDYCGDHINNNTLDNRKQNIRKVANKYNSRNRGRVNSNNKSGYRNVSWINGYWRIQIQKNGKNYIFPEKFLDVNEAGVFAKKMREEIYGEYSGKG